MLAVSARTHAGAVRPMNEDCVMWEPALSLIVVADGMGGHNAGEVASRIALDTIRLFLDKSAEDHDCTWPFGVNPSRSLDTNRLATAVQLANRRVFRDAEQRVEYTGMGTTVVAALVSGAKVIYVNVGDSRLYRVDPDRLTQVSRDDSWAALLSRESALDETAILAHPMRHILTNVVGARPELELTVEEFDLQPGQTLLFCSDGLYTTLAEGDVHAIIAGQPDLDRATDALIQAALDAKCGDNVSVVLARYTPDA
jgi:protein phosphatase